MLKRSLSICGAGDAAGGHGAATELTLSDAPGTPTQASCSHWKPCGSTRRTPYDIRSGARRADDGHGDGHLHVCRRQGNRPARYFPEDVQQAIADMYDVDIDALYMTEFMRLHAARRAGGGRGDDDAAGRRLSARAADRGGAGRRERSGEHRVARRRRAHGAGRGHERDPAGGDRADAGRGHPLQPADRAEGQRGGVIARSRRRTRQLPSKTAYDMVRVGASPMPTATRWRRTSDRRH